MVKIGVLALQGSFREHMECLKKLEGVECFEIRSVSELEKADALILPGGESTAMRRLLDRFGMMTPLRKHIEDGLPVWGTCAGMILLAGELVGEESHLGLMDTVVERNAYGSQLDSFRGEGTWALGKSPIKADMVFIRAPLFVGYGAKIEPVARIGEQIVAIRQENMLATAFHPELIGDLTPYHWLVDQADKRMRMNAADGVCAFAG